jgi:hypothetical protein
MSDKLMESRIRGKYLVATIESLSLVTRTWSYQTYVWKWDWATGQVGTLVSTEHSTLESMAVRNHVMTCFRLAVGEEPNDANTFNEKTTFNFETGTSA